MARYIFCMLLMQSMMYSMEYSTPSPENPPQEAITNISTYPMEEQAPWLQDSEQSDFMAYLWAQERAASLKKKDKTDINNFINAGASHPLPSKVTQHHLQQLLSGESLKKYSSNIKKLPNEAFYRATCPACHKCFKKMTKPPVVHAISEHFTRCFAKKEDWQDIEDPTLFFYVARQCPLFDTPKNNKKKCSYFKKNIVGIKSFIEQVTPLQKHLKNNHTPMTKNSPEIISKKYLKGYILYKEVTQQDIEEKEEEKDDEITPLEHKRRKHN